MKVFKMPEVSCVEGYELSFAMGCPLYYESTCGINYRQK